MRGIRPMERQDRGSCGYGLWCRVFAAERPREQRIMKRKEKRIIWGRLAGWWQRWQATGGGGGEVDEKNSLRGRGRRNFAPEGERPGWRTEHDRSQASRMNRQFRGFSNKRKQRSNGTKATICRSFSPFIFSFERATLVHLKPNC